jgi:amino acid transporter
MNTPVTDQVAAVIAVIEQQAVLALRVGFTLAALVFLFAGVFIFRRRHQFFDRDPNVENDVPVIRHNREDEILFVWIGLTLVLLGILYQVWSA